MDLITTTIEIFYRIFVILRESCTIRIDKMKFGVRASEKRRNVQDSNFKCKRFLIYRSFLVLVLVTRSLRVLTLALALSCVNV